MLFSSRTLFYIHKIQHTLTPGSCLVLYYLSLLLLATRSFTGAARAARVLLKDTLAVAMDREESR